MPNFRKVVANLIVGVGTIAGVTAAEAVVTEYTWEGTVFDAGGLLLPFGIVNGDPITGRFFYDNETALTFTVRSIGIFQHAISGHSFTVGIGSNIFQGMFTNQTVRIFDGSVSLGDQLDFTHPSTGYSGDTIAGVPPSDIFWRLNDHSDTAITTHLVLPAIIEFAEWPDTNSEPVPSEIRFLGFDEVKFTIDAVNMVASVPEYACNGFGSPFDEALVLRKKTKKTVPAKITLVDAGGIPITDTNIDGAPPVISIEFTPFIGDVVIYEEDLESVGASNDGNAFGYNSQTEQWEYRIGTKQLPSSGTYIVTVRSGAESYTIDAGCTNSFTRLN